MSGFLRVATIAFVVIAVFIGWISFWFGLAEDDKIPVPVAFVLGLGVPASIAIGLISRL